MLGSRGATQRISGTDFSSFYKKPLYQNTPRVSPDCLDSVLQHAAQSVGELLKYTKLDGNHTEPTNRKAFDLQVRGICFTGRERHQAAPPRSI